MGEEQGRNRSGTITSIAGPTISISLLSINMSINIVIVIIIIIIIIVMPADAWLGGGDDENDARLRSASMAGSSSMPNMYPEEFPAKAGPAFNTDNRPIPSAQCNENPSLLQLGPASKVIARDHHSVGKLLEQQKAQPCSKAPDSLHASVPLRLRPGQGSEEFVELQTIHDMQPM